MADNPILRSNALMLLLLLLRWVLGRALARSCCDSLDSTLAYAVHVLGCSASSFFIIQKSEYRKLPHFSDLLRNEMAGVTGRSGSLLASDAPARLSPTRGSTASRLTGTTSHARALAPTSAAAGAAGGSRSGTASSAASTTGTGIDYLDAAHGTGCLVCGLDNDHANILLCERCNDEYHTYCLRPALNSVPDGDWFCGE